MYYASFFIYPNIICGQELLNLILQMSPVPLPCKNDI